MINDRSFLPNKVYVYKAMFSCDHCKGPCYIQLISELADDIGSLGFLKRWTATNLSCRCTSIVYDMFFQELTALEQLALTAVYEP